MPLNALYRRFSVATSMACTPARVKMSFAEAERAETKWSLNL